MKYASSIALAFVLLAAPAARADVLTGVSGGAWQAWRSPTEGRMTFWDNTSWDGANCNVGFWITGTGGCTPTPPLLTDFYTGSPGTAPGYFLGTGSEGFFVRREADTVMSGTTIVGVSAASSVTEFGWYSADGTRHALASNMGQGTITPFSIAVPSGDYGFYLQVSTGTAAPPATFMSTRVDPMTGMSQFAAFRLADGRYVIGIEDLAGPGPGDYSDYDYNDYYVILQSASVPEPSSMLLLGMGLIGGGLVLRKRNRQR